MIPNNPKNPRISQFIPKNLGFFGIFWDWDWDLGISWDEVCTPLKNDLAKKKYAELYAKLVSPW